MTHPLYQTNTNIAAQYKTESGKKISFLFPIVAGSDSLATIDVPDIAERPTYKDLLCSL